LEYSNTELIQVCKHEESRDNGAGHTGNIDERGDAWLRDQ
jgi:hypothetical protein